MTQPKKELTPIKIMFPQEMADTMHEIAEVQDRSIASIVRMAMSAWLHDNAQGTNNSILSSTRRTPTLGKGISRKPKKAPERLVG